MESDLEDDLADVMEDSDTEFVVDDEQKDDEKDEDEDDTSIPNTNQTLHAIVHDSAKDNDTSIQDKNINESSIVWTVLLKTKMIP